MVIGLLACALGIALNGGEQVTLPSTAAQGWTPVAAATLGAIPAALLAIGSRHSAMSVLEETATGVLFKAESLHTACSVAFACLCVAGGAVVSSSAATAAAAVRDVLFFCGLSLISARMFRRTLPWILPLAYFVLLQWWGADEYLRPHWWAWPLHRFDDPGSWAASVAVFGLGWMVSVIRPWGLRPAGRRHIP